MALYKSLTFKRLMDQSEQALARAHVLPEYYRIPIGQVLEDRVRYHTWETSHARLMRHVAESRQPLGQAFSLRETTVRMIHRRGLFDYLRTYGVRGAARERLFEIFYGPTDLRAAILREHRQYLLAASSGYCGEVLVGAIHDAHGISMLDRYEEMYRDYFAVFGRFITADVTGDRDIISVLRSAMLTQRLATDKLRAQIFSLGETGSSSQAGGLRAHRVVVGQRLSA